MQEALAIDYSQKNASLKIFPIQPLVSSNELAWKNIYLEYHQQSSFETPIFYPKQHIVIIHNTKVLTGEYQANGKYGSEQIDKGNISIFPANTLCKLQLYGETEFTLLAIETSFINFISCEFSNSNYVEILSKFAHPDSFIYQMTLKLRTEIEVSTNQSVNQFYAQSVANLLAVHLLQHYSQNKYSIKEYKYTVGLPQHKLRRVINYINSNLAQNLSLDDLAQLVHVSSSHFGRLFKQSIGLTPYQYLIERRIEKAKSLLNETELNIADIAEVTGFTSHSHLTTHFRKHVSVTPHAYRQMLQH